MSRKIFKTVEEWYNQQTQTGIVHVHSINEKKKTELDKSRKVSKSTRSKDQQATQEGDE